MSDFRWSRQSNGGMSLIACVRPLRTSHSRLVGRTLGLRCVSRSQTQPINTSANTTQSQTYEHHQPHY